MSGIRRTNRELVVYVLGRLGGSFRPIHTEEIALMCHKLFPDKFSWTRYPDLPDKETVRFALMDARKVRYDNLVDGRSGQGLGHPSKTKRQRTLDGWVLTNAGIRWFKSQASAIDSEASTRQPSDHRQSALRRLKRIFGHRLYYEYAQNPRLFDPSLGDLASLLRCRVDAPPNVWETRFQALNRDATLTDRVELSAFVAACHKAYCAKR